MFRLLFLLITLQAVSQESGLPNYKVRMKSGTLYFSSNFSNKVSLDVKQFIKKKEYYKWSLHGVTLNLYSEDGETLIDQVSYKKGSYKESLGTWFLSEKSKSKTGFERCYNFPDVIYLSQKEGLLKSPTGFYLDLSEKLDGCNETKQTT